MTVATLSLPKPNALTLLRRVTLSAARADVVFDHLPQDFFNLKVNVFGVNTDASATNGHAQMQFNGDTGTNYSWQEISHPGNVAVIGGEATSATNLLFGFTGTGDDPLVPGEATSTIYDYTGKTRNKVALSDEYARAPSIPFSTVVTFSGWWTPATPQAIHSIRIFPEAGSWAANTIISLWGEP